MPPTIALKPDIQKQLRASITRYVEENMEQEIGDLKAGSLLDFVLKEIGPTIYNLAIADAQTYFQERALDLESVCYQKEFSYWETRRQEQTRTDKNRQGQKP
jgi:uncharacterized protein (DUF2164 family)